MIIRRDEFWSAPKLLLSNGAIPNARVTSGTCCAQNLIITLQITISFTSSTSFCCFEIRFLRLMWFCVLLVSRNHIVNSFDIFKIFSQFLFLPHFTTNLFIIKPQNYLALNILSIKSTKPSVKKIKFLAEIYDLSRTTSKHKLKKKLYFDDAMQWNVKKPKLVVVTSVYKVCSVERSKRSYNSLQDFMLHKALSSPCIASYQPALLEFFLKYSKKSRIDWQLQ